MNKEVSKAPHYLEDSHLDKGTKEFLKVLNSGGKPVESLPVAEGRKVLEGAQSSVETDLSGIKESEKTIKVDNFEIKLTVVHPENAKEKLPAFMFIHGGGWVLGDYPTHKRLIRDLVVESGFPAVYVDYSRSPEAKYPQAVNEIYVAAKWVSEHGDEIDVDGKRLAMVGNSVGGNMSIVTSLKAKENNGPKFKAQILLWPIVDTRIDYPSYKMFGEERFLTTPLMVWMLDQYTTDQKERESIYISPLNASLEQLKGLPPTLIEVAENDVLRDGGEALGRKLDEAGVDTTTIRFNGVIHDWGMLNGFKDIPGTKASIMLSAAFLKKYLE
ncbi:MAG: alpha/beta hydrolase [Dysgonomonas sp.]|nr:alpha/beta hydrolase [Dysgonomonas sp.]